jgi:hypothetical protein
MYKRQRVSTASMARQFPDEPNGPDAEGGSVSEPKPETAARGSRSDSPEQTDRSDQMLILVHHHPGYLRIRAGAFIEPEDDNPVVTAARTAAETVPGFRSWSLNPRTGSVVIEYDPGTLEADDLLKHIAKSAGMRGVEISTSRERNRQELVTAFLDTVQDVNQVVSQLTGERADLRELVPLALVATSVVSFVLNDDRSRLPHWSSALYRSYRIFMHWHRREVRTRERIARQREESGGGGGKRADRR